MIAKILNKLKPKKCSTSDTDWKEVHWHSDF